MKKQVLSMLIGAAGPLLLQIVTALIDAKTFDTLVNIANAKVLELEGIDLPGEEKRRRALREIKASLAAKGITAQTILINLAIELAVGALRSKLE